MRTIIFLRGMASLQKWTKESNDEALRLFYQSIERDPNFASAYGMASWCFVWRKVSGWMGDRTKEVAEAERLARRAVELGPDDAIALSGGGYALVFVLHDPTMAQLLLKGRLSSIRILLGPCIQADGLKFFLVSRMQQLSIYRTQCV